jgi:hypothetical protein
MTSRDIYPKVKRSNVGKFILSMTGVTSALVGLEYYKRKNYKINLVLGLNGTLVSVKPIDANKIVNNTKTIDVWTPHIPRMVLTYKTDQPSLEITYENQKYNVWIRPYSSVMFYMLQPFCNFYLYTVTDQSVAEEILKETGWTDKFVKKKFRDKVYEKKHCKDIISLSTSIMELIDHQNILVDDHLTMDCQTKYGRNYPFPYKFIHIPEFSKNVKGDYEMVKLTGRIIYKFFAN